MRGGDIRRDGQPQAGAAALPRARGIEPDEPVEYSQTFGLGYARSVVLDHDVCAVPCCRKQCSHTCDPGMSALALSTRLRTKPGQRTWVTVTRNRRNRSTVTVRSRDPGDSGLFGEKDVIEIDIDYGTHGCSAFALVGTGKCQTGPR